MYDCPMSLKDMGKMDRRVSITVHDKYQTMYLFLEINIYFDEEGLDTHTIYVIEYHNIQPYTFITQSNDANMSHKITLSKWL